MNRENKTGSTKPSRLPRKTPQHPLEALLDAGDYRALGAALWRVFLFENRRSNTFWLASTILGSLNSRQLRQIEER